jgi:hypothetical protein
MVPRCSAGVGTRSSTGGEKPAAGCRPLNPSRPIAPARAAGGAVTLSCSEAPRGRNRLTRSTVLGAYLHSAPFAPGLSALRVLTVAVQFRHRPGAGAIVAAILVAGPRVTLTALVRALAVALLCHDVAPFGGLKAYKLGRSSRRCNARARTEGGRDASRTACAGGHLRRHPRAPTAEARPCGRLRSERVVDTAPVDVLVRRSSSAAFRQRGPGELPLYC